MCLFQRDSEREKKKTAAVAMRFDPRILIGWMGMDYLDSSWRCNQNGDYLPKIRFG